MCIYMGHEHANPLAPVEGSHKTEEVLSWKGKRVFKLTRRPYQKAPPVSRRGTAFPRQGHGRVRIERPQSSGGPVANPRLGTGVNLQLSRAKQK